MSGEVQSSTNEELNRWAKRVHNACVGQAVIGISATPPATDAPSLPSHDRTEEVGSNLWRVSPRSSLVRTRVGRDAEAK